MSAHEGKKISTAIDAFNKSTMSDPDRSPIVLIAHTLQRRSLGEKHFQQMYDHLNESRKVAIVKVAEEFSYNPDAPLSERNLSLFLCYMSVNSRQGQTIYDEYGPQITQVKMTNNVLAYTNRTLPVIFSSQHTEFRFVQRTGQKLDYASDDSQWAMITALMMAMTIIEPMHDAGKMHTAIALPYTNGLYLGHASRCRSESFYPQEYVMAVHGGPGRKSMLHGIMDGTATLTKPDWSPQTVLKINTFISDREFHRDQTELYDQFLTVFRDRRTLNVYNYMINSYVNLLPETKVFNDLQWVKGKFQEIYASPAWASVTRHAQKHLPRLDLE